MRSEGRLPDIPYRVGELERRISHLEDRAEALPVLTANGEYLSKELNILGEEVRALRRAIVTAAISFAGSALLIAVSVLIALK
jgi:hypothetical protein